MRGLFVFDLYVYPFGYQGKNEHSNLTGLFVGNILRKANRTRAEDIIVFRFTPIRVLSSEEKNFINDLVINTCELFYKTKGPITTAAKKSVDFFNEKLVSLNSRNAYKNNLLGSIHFLIFNKENLYILQAGGSATFILSKNKIKKFEEKSYGVEGVGMGRSISPKFHHSKMNLNDRLILSAKYPPSWTKEKLLDDQKLSISHLRKTLLEVSDRDFEAVIIQLREGVGNIHQLKLDSSDDISFDGEIEADLKIDDQKPEEVLFDQSDYSEKEEQSSLEFQNQENPVHEKFTAADIDVPPFDQEKIGEDSSLTPSIETSGFENENIQEEVSSQFNDYPTVDEVNANYSLLEQQEDKIDDEIGAFPPDEELSTAGEVDKGLYISGEKFEIPSDSEVEIIRKPKEKKNNKTFTIFLIKSRSFFYNVNAKFESIKSKLNSFVLKSLRSTSLSGDNNHNSLSSTSMLMIAILVAVFVSAIGITVYLQSGLGSQQKELIANANLLVADALEDPDDSNKILLYEEALRLVTESENYGKSQEISDFKSFIQKELDTIKGVTRLDVQFTILGGLDRRINIQRMVIHEAGDLYALDGGTGRVIRMISTSSDYVVDTTFTCGPGKYGDVIVDPLVDIEAVNFANDLNAKLMGIDARGNLILCSQSADPIAIQLKQAEISWGEIKALAFNGYNLFVLDTGDVTRDIYRYPANDYAFDLIPESIFSTNLPENLTGAVDIAVNQEELYLIHQNSELTRCNLLGGRTASTCEDNVGYGVIIDGKSRENVSTISGTNFTQIYLTEPPDPSIYFLDGNSGSVYHFSLAINLQQLINPNLNKVPNASEESILTAFAVNPNGIIHFAYGNQIYYGFLP